jgi:hypothetical protein
MLEPLDKSQQARAAVLQQRVGTRIKKRLGVRIKKQGI